MLYFTKIMKKELSQNHSSKGVIYMSKIKQYLQPMNKERIHSYVSKFREKNIPKRYNQIKLMNYLLDDELDHYISISNRADGKSFNYIDFLITFSKDYDLGFMFIVRHHTVQMFGQTLMQKIIDTSNNNYNYRDFIFVNNDFYKTLIYKDKAIAIITDLNKATDLKYNSNFLKDFPILVYDEFLALEGDYLPDEWDKLKTIYSSVDRNGGIPLIKYPKILYLGNAVNFSSPVLANLNIFNILERHPMNEVRKYDNVILEFNRNENANEERNLRAFDEKNDSMTHGEFEVNKHNIATENDRLRINKKPDYLIVKLFNEYLKITYNRDTYEAMLSIISYSPNYDFNYLIKDNNEQSTFLNESFYDNEHERKYNKDIFLFDNVYSKDFILSEMNNYRDLKINKIIKHHASNNTLDNFEMREKVYKENYIENTKKSLFKKFFQ